MWRDYINSKTNIWHFEGHEWEYSKSAKVHAYEETDPGSWTSSSRLVLACWTPNIALSSQFECRRMQILPGDDRRAQDACSSLVPRSEFDTKSVTEFTLETFQETRRLRQASLLAGLDRQAGWQLEWRNSKSRCKPTCLTWPEILQEGERQREQRCPFGDIMTAANLRRFTTRIRDSAHPRH